MDRRRTGPAGHAAAVPRCAAPDPSEAPTIEGVSPPAPRPAVPAELGARSRRRRTGDAGHVHDVLVVGGGPVGVVVRLLAGRGRLGRGPGGEEGLPPREDLRRRADPPVGPPDRRHGHRGGPGRRPPLRRAAGPRLRQGARPALARAPELPLLRLRDHPPRPRRHRQRAGRQGRGHRVAGHRGGRAGPRARRRAGRPPGAGCRRAWARWSRRRPPGPPATVRARYVVVADGANSRFGRALGTTRDRDQPMGMALRGYYTSPGHDQPFIESHLDIRDGDGKVVPGYGWIFPLGRRPGQRRRRACCPPTDGGRASTPPP